MHEIEAPELPHMPALHKRRSRRLRGLSPTRADISPSTLAVSKRDATHRSLRAPISNIPQSQSAPLAEPQGSKTHPMGVRTTRSSSVRLYTLPQRARQSPISADTARTKSGPAVAATCMGITRRNQPQRNVNLRHASAAAYHDQATAAVPKGPGISNPHFASQSRIISPKTPAHTQPLENSDSDSPEPPPGTVRIRRRFYTKLNLKMDCHPTFFRSQFLDTTSPPVLFVHRYSHGSRLLQVNTPQAVESLIESLDVGVGGSGWMGVIAACKHPRLFNILQQYYTAAANSHMAPELDSIRARLHPTILEIREAWQKLSNFRTHIMRYVREYLVSPLSHEALFPGSDLLPNFETSIIPLQMFPEHLLPRWQNLNTKLSFAVRHHFQGYDILTLNLSPTHPSDELFSSILRSPNSNYTSFPQRSFGIGAPQNGIPVLMIDCPQTPLLHGREDIMYVERMRSENRLVVAASALLRSIDEHLFGGHAWPQHSGTNNMGWIWPGIETTESHNLGPEVPGYPDGIDEIEIRSKCLMVITVSVLNARGRWGVVFVDGEGRIVMHNCIQDDDNWDLGTLSGVFEFIKWLGMVRVWLDREWIPAMCTALKSRRVS